jgi:hypothetical protein
MHRKHIYFVSNASLLGGSELRMLRVILKLHSESGGNNCYSCQREREALLAKLFLSMFTFVPEIVTFSLIFIVERMIYWWT